MEAAPPRPRPAAESEVAVRELRFSAFVFKVQANMDPGHRGRVALCLLRSHSARRPPCRKNVWRSVVFF